MEKIFNMMSKVGGNNVDMLVKWMKDAEVFKSLHDEEEFRKLFCGHQLVSFEQFKHRIRRYAKHHRTTVKAIFFKLISHHAAKFLQKLGGHFNLGNFLRKLGGVKPSNNANDVRNYFSRPPPQKEQSTEEQSKEYSGDQSVYSEISFEQHSVHSEIHDYDSLKESEHFAEFPSEHHSRSY